MSTKKHSSKPTDIILARCNTGELPSRHSVSDPIINEFHRLLNWAQGGQIFTYTGPGPTLQTIDDAKAEMNPAYNYRDEVATDPCYEVILHAPPKADTSNPARRLYGVLIPWQVVPHQCRMLGEVTVPAAVTWEADRGASTYEQTLWRSTTQSANWAQRVPTGDSAPSDGASAFHTIDNKPIELFDSVTDGVLLDGNCNASHLHCWLSANDATLTKATATPAPYSGEYCLKVAHGGTANAYAYPKYPQSPNVGSADCLPIKAGRDYQITGMYITDGTATASVICGGDTLLNAGSASTWTSFHAGFTADAGVLAFRNNRDAAGWVAFDSIRIKERGTFAYEPSATGEFTVGKLRTDRIKVAALSIFQCPDRMLEPAQAVVTPDHVAAGKAIRGYDASGDKSIGTLVHKMGRGPYTSYDDDDVERMTRRCLFSWGHPTGIGTTSATEVNWRNNEDSWLKIETRNLTNNSGASSVFALPAVVAYATGASGGDPAYVRITAYNSGSSNTWTYTITDGGGLYGGNAAGGLALASGIDRIKVTLEAPTSGSVWVKTVTLWESGCDVY